LSIARGTIVDRVVRSWWLIESWAGALSQPRADVRLEDAAVERIVRDSAIGRAASAVWRAARVASAGSGVIAIARRAVPRTASPAITLRASGAVIAVASATALALDMFRPTPVGPWSWLLPVVCAVAAAAGMMFAGSLARMFAQPRR